MLQFLPNNFLHNETNTDDAENSSHQVDSTIVRTDSALLEDDEMKGVCKKLRVSFGTLDGIQN